MSEGPRVLVVEDDAHLRRSLLLVLSAEGYEAEGAVDGEEGCRRMLEGGWSLVLTDTMMPRLGGIEMLRRFAASGSAPPPVILVSAAFTLPPEEECAALGVREVVRKPFHFDNLLKVIGGVVPG